MKPLETLCWSCAKCTSDMLCDWADGVERTDWEVQHNELGLLVVKCGGYIKDWERANVKRVAEILGCSTKAVTRNHERVIIERLKQHGYYARVDYHKPRYKNVKKERYYYVKKIDGEQIPPR